MGEEGVEELFARTMVVAVTRKLISKKALVSIIVDSTVQDKAVPHPTDSKLLQTSRSKVVLAVNLNGIELMKIYAKVGQRPVNKARHYAHAHWALQVLSPNVTL